MAGGLYARLRANVPYAVEDFMALMARARTVRGCARSLARPGAAADA